MMKKANRDDEEQGQEESEEESEGEEEDEEAEGEEEVSEGTATAEEEEMERAWRIDDASKINVNTTKLVAAAFARGNGISAFANSIDDPILLLPPRLSASITSPADPRRNLSFSRFELFQAARPVMPSLLN